MLNKILLTFLQKNTSIDPLQNDAFEEASFYKGYILPLRYLLAMRYLKHKHAVLDQFRRDATFPIPVDAFKQRLLTRLTPTNNISTTPPIFSHPLKAWFIYPLLLSGLILSAGLFQHWLTNQRLQAMLATRLPYYSDLHHRALLFKYSGYPEAHQKILLEIDKERQNIVNQLPENETLKQAMEQGLIKLTQKEASSEDILLAFKSINMMFDQNNLPYYITPKIFTLPCSSFVDSPLEEFLALKKMESILTGDNPEKCHTTMLTVYHVAKRNRLQYGAVELPLFHVKRIDKVPATDGALGLTFGEQGLGSIILLERIKEFATDSVIPALTFQGRSTLIPFWLQGYYDVEEAISREYKQTLREIYPNKTELKQLKTVAKQILKNKHKMTASRMRQTLQRADGTSDQGILGGGLDAISALLGGKDKTDNKIKKKIQAIDFSILNKLNQALLPSIEYHEAYHQIDKKSWQKPLWVDDLFKDLTKNGKEHTLEELGAYLTQLTYTEKGSDIWLTKLLFFSLNAMMRNQPEYYASSVILSTMDSLYRGEKVSVNYKLSVDEKIKIYKAFTTMKKNNLKMLAERAYIELFRRPVPEMTR